jgi:hypothetical protein
VVACEKEFNCTIKRNTDLPTLIASGTPYQTITEKLKRLATGYNYDQPVILPPDEPWILPAGAFGENCGAM